MAALVRESIRIKPARQFDDRLNCQNSALAKSINRLQEVQERDGARIA
jgi:hypothetical protein